MRKFLSLLLLLGLWTGRAQTNAPSLFAYDSFRLITDRNIFNPRRSARYVPSERTRTRAVRADSFALVGTLSYEKGLFAFFDGSSPDYRKVLKEEDTIAGFKIAEIQPSYVKLASPTNQVELRVGMQLQHSDDGEWQASERTDNSSPAAAASTSRLPAQGRVGRNASVVPTVAEGASSTNTPDMQAPPEDGPSNGSAVAQEPPAAAEATPASSNSSNDVLERLKRKAAEERGEKPQ